MSQRHPAYDPSKKSEELAIRVREAHRQFQRAVLELESAEQEFKRLETEIPRLRELVKKLRAHRDILDREFEQKVAEPEKKSKEQQLEELMAKIARLQSEIG